jgi:hypothetical protein
MREFVRENVGSHRPEGGAWITDLAGTYTFVFV